MTKIHLLFLTSLVTISYREHDEGGKWSLRKKDREKFLDR